MLNAQFGKQPPGYTPPASDEKACSGGTGCTQASHHHRHRALGLFWERGAGRPGLRQLLAITAELRQLSAASGRPGARKKRRRRRRWPSIQRPGAASRQDATDRVPVPGSGCGHSSRRGAVAGPLTAGTATGAADESGRSAKRSEDIYCHQQSRVEDWGSVRII